MASSVKLDKDASGRLTASIDNVSKSKYSSLLKKISKNFDLKANGELTDGMDEVFQEYTDGEVSVSIEWDIWSGFSVVALNEDSDPLVKKVFESL